MDTHNLQVKLEMAKYLLQRKFGKRWYTARKYRDEFACENGLGAMRAMILGRTYLRCKKERKRQVKDRS